MSIKRPAIINITKRAMEANPGHQVLTDADGVVIAICPLTDTRLPDGSFSHAGEIQLALNGGGPVNDLIEALAPFIAAEEAYRALAADVAAFYKEEPSAENNATIFPDKMVVLATSSPHGTYITHGDFRQLAKALKEFKEQRK